MMLDLGSEHCRCCLFQMLTDLGNAVYVDDFENHFITASLEFYKASAPHFPTLK